MANQKIHEYPIERFVYGDDDYYDVDFWDGLVYQTAKIKGSVIKNAMLTGIAINLTAPSAFIVGGSPTDGTGTLTLTGAGLANQYIRGDGTLATFPTSGGGGNSVNYYLNGGTAASEVNYYQMSKTAVIGVGVNFSLAGNGLISQWLTDLGDPNVTEIPAGNWNFELYFSASSLGGTPAFYIEILKFDGTTFTTIADNSANPENISSGTITDLYLTSVAVPLTALLVTDRLALRVYIVNSVIGRTITLHTQDSNLCEVTTTFSSGISSINMLTVQTQYMVVDTIGNDFNITASLDTHIFNLPTASAVDRGALSPADWIDFDAKQDPITLTTTGTGAATLITNTLNIPTPALSSGTVTSVSVTTANGVSGTVATATTTPAISLTLGAITPTSVNSVAVSGSATPTLSVTGTSAISGTNTGDQTSIVGITGTKAQFDTAVTDGNFLYVGDVTQYTDELAQDAVGNILVNTSTVNLSYADGIPSITANVANASIGPTQLSATGTPSATTYLRGDNTWATPASTGPEGWTTIVKSANQDVTNSATLVDDTDLQFSVVAGGHYMMELDICYSGNNTTGGYKFALRVSSGNMKGQGNLLAYSSAGAITNSGLAANSAIVTNAPSLGVIIADLEMLTFLKIVFPFTASANGTLSYQFANTTAAAGRTSRTWKGSILRYKRID